MNILHPSLLGVRHPSYRSFLVSLPSRQNQTVRRSAIDERSSGSSLSPSLSLSSSLPFRSPLFRSFHPDRHRSPFPFFFTPRTILYTFPPPFCFSFIASASLGIVPLYLCAYQSTNRKRDAIKGADCHKRMQITRTLHRYLKRKY